MKRHEAEQEAKRLNQEHPERGEFRWVPAPQADGSWIVAKMARIARDEQPATRTTSPREPRPRKAGSRPAAAKPPAKPPARGLRGIAKRREVRIAFLTLALALAGFILWELRLLLRPLFMTLLVRRPALVSIPLIAGGSAFLVHLGVKLARRRPPAHPQPARGGGRPPAAHDGGAWRRGRLRVRRAVAGPLWGPGPVRTLLVCGALGFLFAGAMTSVWTGAAIYDHTDYGALSLDRLKGGQVRIKPYEVARGQTENSLNSPTEHPTNLHIVSERAPDVDERARPGWLLPRPHQADQGCDIGRRRLDRPGSQAVGSQSRRGLPLRAGHEDLREHPLAGLQEEVLHL